MVEEDTNDVSEAPHPDFKKHRVSLTLPLHDYERLEDYAHERRQGIATVAHELLMWALNRLTPSREKEREGENQ